MTILAVPTELLLHYLFYTLCQSSMACGNIGVIAKLNSYLSMSIEVSKEIAKLSMPELQSLMDVCQTDAVRASSIGLLKVYLHPQLSVVSGICICSKAPKYSFLLFKVAV